MSKPATRPGRNSRRAFIRHLGATAAAAVGVAALPRGAHAASPSHDGDIDPQACAIYCYMDSCPCPGAPAQTRFHCVSQCGGSWHVCYQRSCVGFCFSQSAC